MPGRKKKANRAPLVKDKYGSTIPVNSELNLQQEELVALAPEVDAEFDPFEFPVPGSRAAEFDPFTDDFQTASSPFEVAALTFEPKPDYLSDPGLWGRERLQEHYWSKQQEILLSLRDNRYTAVKSCHGAGKSFIGARAMASWIDNHDPGEAFIVSTAPTSAQVSAILWRELSKAHTKGSLPGSITTSGYPMWKLGSQLVGYGRKPADYTTSAFQGIHERYVLVVLDEAGGIPPGLFDSVDALATNRHARVLAIGNPDDPTSHFAKICRPGSGWNVINIDALSSPNFTQEQVEWMDCPECRERGRTTPLLKELMQEEKIPYSAEFIPDSMRDMLIDPMWVEERLHRWVGIPDSANPISKLATQSSIFTAKVRGEFPSESSEGVCPLGWVEAAMARWRDWRDQGFPEPKGRRVLGADIARGGEDATCIAIRQGSAVYEVQKHRYADTMQTTNYISSLYTTQAMSVVDVIGVGAGVVDRLRELKKDVIPFNASNSAAGMFDQSGTLGFVNYRAAAWWNLRELLDPSRGSTLMIPDDEDLKADLTTPRWVVRSGGKVQIESKDDIRKRLGRSTDQGDAVVQAFWAGLALQTTDEGESAVLSWWDAESDGSVLSWGIDGSAVK